MKLAKTIEELPDGCERIARAFHDTYERLAPQFGYETRPDTKAFDSASPNGQLMIAVIRELNIDVTREKLHQLVHYRNEFKRLTATLRKCATAIDSLPSDALGEGTDRDNDSHWYLRDELLGEIREVLDAK